MNLSEMTDEQCMDSFQEFLKERVKLGTAYVTDEETGLLTHQILVIEIGELMAQSTPEELTYPFQPIGFTAEPRVLN
jgi:hypothetical protein